MYEYFYFNFSTSIFHYFLSLIYENKMCFVFFSSDHSSYWSSTTVKIRFIQTLLQEMITSYKLRVANSLRLILTDLQRGLGGVLRGPLAGSNLSRLDGGPLLVILGYRIVVEQAGRLHIDFHRLRGPPTSDGSLPTRLLQEMRIVRGETSSVDVWWEAPWKIGRLKSVLKFKHQKKFVCTILKINITQLIANNKWKFMIIWI